MTTTNKAFIDAYQGGTRQRTVRPLRSDDFVGGVFGTSELVSATAGSSIDTFETEAPATAPAVDEPRVDRGHLPQRRPLSEVQAEELFGVAAPAATACQPNWPERCQQLLAGAADRYDAVLRKLPTGSTGTLIGIVGTGPRSGCTTTAICLALRSSALGFTAALVDGNLAQGGLAKALAMEQFASWGSLLGTTASVATAIQPSDDVGVDLLLTQPIAVSSLESAARFRASLAAGVLRRKYERVVIDLGAPAAGEATLVADLTAAMGIDFLLATATPATTAAELAATKAAVAGHGLNIAGVIEAV